MRRTALAAALVLLAGCGGQADPKLLQGYVEGEYVRVAAPFGGTLVKLHVQRGQDVAAGAPLFALEDENEAAARREAEERVKRAAAQVDDLRKGLRPTEIEAVRAQLAQAEVVADLSAREHARQLELVARGFVSQQRADEARAARDRDRGKVAELRAQLGTARAGARPDELRAAQAEARAAREALAQAEWRFQQRSVVATVSGTVTDTLFSAGEWVPAGAPVASILPPGNVKVRFFVPEAGLAAVAPGQTVRLACSGCAADLQATVSFVASQAEYTPPVIYSKENRSRMVFLVEARPAPGQAAKLHPGQPVDVTLP